MRIRMKFLGSAANFTTNADYDMLGMVVNTSNIKQGAFVDDNGDLKFSSNIDDTGTWDLVSVTTVTGVQIYP